MTKHDHPWEYPPCPECGHEIYVGGDYRADAEYKCYKCNTRFNPPAEVVSQNRSVSPGPTPETPDPDGVSGVAKELEDADPNDYP